MSYFDRFCLLHGSTKHWIFVVDMVIIMLLQNFYYETKNIFSTHLSDSLILEVLTTAAT
jgi:hypothetical protein